jgi:hypothetical protein
MALGAGKVVSQRLPTAVLAIGGQICDFGSPRFFVFFFVSFSAWRRKRGEE